MIVESNSLPRVRDLSSTQQRRSEIAKVEGEIRSRIREPEIVELVSDQSTIRGRVRNESLCLSALKTFDPVAAPLRGSIRMEIPFVISIESTCRMPVVRKTKTKLS